jgi:hypothetical protein
VAMNSTTTVWSGVLQLGWGSSCLQWQGSRTRRRDEGYLCSMSVCNYGTCIP